MSTMIAPPRNEAAGRRAGEARLVVPDVSWRVYETWVDSLPEPTPVRMAYDGRDLEIMTKGPDHSTSLTYLALSFTTAPLNHAANQLRQVGIAYYQYLR